MGSFSFTIDTTVPPDRVLAALTDFSDKRPDIWPTISRTYCPRRHATRVGGSGTDTGRSGGT